MWLLSPSWEFCFTDSGNHILIILLCAPDLVLSGRDCFHHLENFDSLGRPWPGCRAVSGRDCSQCSGQWPRGRHCQAGIVVETQQHSALKIANVNKTEMNYFRDIFVLFFKVESWNFQNLFRKEFHETSRNFNTLSFFFFVFSIHCLIELKFCEFSRNRYWNFQLSTLKNVLCLKK